MPYIKTNFAFNTHKCVLRYTNVSLKLEFYADSSYLANEVMIYNCVSSKTYIWTFKNILTHGKKKNYFTFETYL